MWQMGRVIKPIGHKSGRGETGSGKSQTGGARVQQGGGKQWMVINQNRVCRNLPEGCLLSRVLIKKERGKDRRKS